MESESLGKVLQVLLPPTSSEARTPTELTMPKIDPDECLVTFVPLCLGGLHFTRDEVLCPTELEASRGECSPTSSDSVDIHIRLY